MANDHCSICGAIPSSLLTDQIRRLGFQSLPQHVRSRLTLPFCNTSTDPRIIAFYYDMLTNLSCNHSHTGSVINRRLMSGDDISGGLILLGKGDSSILGSIDSKKIVKGLCASQKYHKMDFFLTFTCNMKKHYGMKMIMKWINSDEWNKSFNGFDKLDQFECDEIKKGLMQSASGILLRNWQEICILFINYLRRSPSSPFRNLLSIFSRN